MRLCCRGPHRGAGLSLDVAPFRHAFSVRREHSWLRARREERHLDEAAEKPQLTFGRALMPSHTAMARLSPWGYPHPLRRFRLFPTSFYATARPCASVHLGSKTRRRCSTSSAACPTEVSISAS